MLVVKVDEIFKKTLQLRIEPEQLEFFVFNFFYFW